MLSTLFQQHNLSPYLSFVHHQLGPMEEMYVTEEAAGANTPGM